ncbi:MAG: DegV family protein [Acidobacteriota bacterium]
MRPAVLIVDPDDVRRRVLSQGLAERGYEVIPAASAEEGLKFARGLGPSVIVGEASLPGFGDGSILDQFSVRDVAGIRRTLVVLAPAGTVLDELPVDAFEVRVDGLELDEVRRRIRLVLVGRELGVDADPDLQYLVGDLAFLPLVDVTRSLAAAHVTGIVRTADGSVAFERGRPVAGRLETSRASERPSIGGAKAFCRLARRSAGPFRIYLGPSDLEHDIEASLDDLLLQALEEAHMEMPDPHLRIRMADVRDIPSGELTAQEVQLAAVIDQCKTVGDALNRMTAADGLVVQALRKMMDRGALVVEKPKTAVKVVTDSTGDLPPELARRHEILVVPLTVHFGADAYRDGVDIRARDFYQLLGESDTHPSTNPPPEAVFYEHFHDLIAEQDVVAVHISEKLSKTASHARQAALRGMRTFDHLPPERHKFALEVVDSQSVSMGVGLQALFAARMALRGEGVFSIAQRLRQVPQRMHLLFAVDSLEFLERGGRIGKARALLGKLLSIKPILGVVDGEVAAVDRARGGRRVHPRIVQLVAERVDVERGLVVCVAHASAPVWADRLAKLMKQSFKILELITTDIGPVVGTHSGPGTVGVVVFQPTDEEWALFAPVPD